MPVPIPVVRGVPGAQVARVPDPVPIPVELIGVGELRAVVVRAREPVVLGIRARNARIHRVVLGPVGGAGGRRHRLGGRN